MKNIESQLYTGWVRHRRWLPKQHTFRYPVFMTWLNLNQLQSVTRRSPFWSTERFNLISYYRKDYIDSEIPDIKQAVQQRIYKETGQKFDGTICLLTNLRYLGFSFNPVSFYFCYPDEQLKPRFIVAEINNTPWDERFCYVLDCQSDDTNKDSWQFEFDKTFHVSPFMPMDLVYRWQFCIKDRFLTIHMRLSEQGKHNFDATLHLQPQAMQRQNMLYIPIKYPFMTLTILWRIYWQAFCIWLKKVPSFDHPNKHIKVR